MKYRLRRYESGTMCRMALAYTPELPNSNLVNLFTSRSIYRGLMSGVPIFYLVRATARRKAGQKRRSRKNKPLHIARITSGM